MPDQEVVLFHGSNVVVKKPQILISGFYKDFGYGFYCTKLEKLFCTQKSLESIKFKESISL